MNDVCVALALFVTTFLLGSIPWGLIISRVFFGQDIREHGSGNIGTTNAMRTLGRAGGAAVFVLDFCKGLLSGFLALFAATLLVGAGATDTTTSVTTAATQGVTSAFISKDTLLGIAYFACVYGHIFSPWLKFKGGKGIAVAIGALFVVYGVVGACLELLIFAMVVAISRYVSAGSIASAAACPFFALYFYWGRWPAVVLCSLVGITVVWAHRSNIERLLSGTERKVGQ